MSKTNNGTTVVDRARPIDHQKAHEFQASAPHFAPVSIPRFVQIKVNVLRGWSAQPAAMSDKLYDESLERNATIFLNALPVHYIRSESPTSAEVR